MIDDDPMAHFRKSHPMQTPRHGMSAARLPSRDSSSYVLPRFTPVEAAAASHRRLLSLHELEKVLVSSATSRRQGTRYYTLEVYTSSSPTSPSDFDARGSMLNKSEGARQSALPYGVDKTLADFDNLRQALYNASHLAHTSVSCEFCKEMVLFLDMGDNNKFGNTVLRILVGRGKIIRSLQQFVDDVLDILVHFACVEGTPWCSGQGRSHQVVRQFLLPRV